MKLVISNGKKILKIAQSELSIVTNENYDDFINVRNEINKLKDKQQKLLQKYKHGYGLLKLPEENLKYEADNGNEKAKIDLEKYIILENLIKQIIDKTGYFK